MNTREAAESEEHNHNEEQRQEEENNEHKKTNKCQQQTGERETWRSGRSSARGDMKSQRRPDRLTLSQL